MRTQKYTQVEALVSKYKNQAKQNKSVIAVEQEMSLIFEIHVAVSPDVNVIDFERQLLAHFYFLAFQKDTDDIIVEQFGRYRKYYLKEILTVEEEEFLTDNFDCLVEYLFDHYDSWAQQPISMAAPLGWSCLVEHLLEKKEGIKVFLPYTNIGQELIGLQNCTAIVGEGCENAALLNLYTNNVVEKYKELEGRENAFWANIKAQTFDVFVGDIPTHFTLHSKKLSEYLNAIYTLVCDGGDILIGMSREHLINEDTNAFRRSIINKREISEIIELPNDRILMHIIKSRQDDTIVMADASSITQERGWGHGFKELDVHRFVSMVNHADQPEFDENPICRRYEYAQLKKEILFPSFYLNSIEGMNLSTLVGVCSNVVTSDECDINEKVVTTNNLSHVFSNGEIVVKQLKTIDKSRFRRYKKVDSYCVVVSVSPQNIAIGYKTDNLSILVPNNLQVILTKTADDARFIAACFLSEKIKNQICSFVVKMKGLVPQLCENWFEYVTIPKLTKEEQIEYVRNISRIDWFNQDKESIAASARFKQAIHLRKHALSQNISSFDSLFRTLEMCFQEQGGKLNKTDKISPVSNITVAESFNLLKEKLTVIRNRVDHIAEDQDWGPCETVDPQQFVEEFESKHPGINFKYLNDWPDYDKNYFEKDVIDRKTGKLLFHAGESFHAMWISKNALNQIIENIVDNAKEHGFTDSQRDNYRINFSWTTDGLNILLNIANNGTPISDDMNTDNILQYGYSSSLNKGGHGGIGGGQIAEILHEYGGSVKVVSTPTSMYTVTYILSIPLASIY